MPDGILTPCNVARSRHWFRQVTAPWSMACGSGIVTVNSPSGSTLQCDTWLWDDMPSNSRKRPPYWNSTSGFDFDRITAVDLSFCTSLRNFIQIGLPGQKKMTSCRLSRWRILAILDFMGPIIASLESRCTTSYTSSVDTIALNCWVFEKIAFFAFWRQTDTQTNRQTDRLTNKQIDSIVALSRSRCRERRLNKYLCCRKEAARCFVSASS